jgi:hypothetical protein
MNFVCDVQSSITLQHVVHIVTTVLLKGQQKKKKLNAKKKCGLLSLPSYRGKHICITAHCGQADGAGAVTNHRPELWKDYKSWRRKTE